MTVKELIQELSKFDENKPVLINVINEGKVDYDEVEEVFDPCGDGTPMII